jgi:hypothetical protein
MWLAKIIFFNRLIIFDAFLSLYDSNVNDRKVYSGIGLRGMRDFLLDWYSIRLANIILLDTQEHISYFLSRFGGNPKRFVRVFVGTDDTVLFPRTRMSPIR